MESKFVYLRDTPVVNASKSLLDPLVPMNGDECRKLNVQGLSSFH